MNRLPKSKQIQVVAALVEGMSIRATVRMTGVAKNTIVKLLAELGAACATYQDKALRDLPCKRIECDEIWSFVGAKDKNIAPDKKAYGIGSVWTWTAICATTKLVPSWLIGDRDGGTARNFIDDLVSRLANRVQITTAHAAHSLTCLQSGPKFADVSAMDQGKPPERRPLDAILAGQPVGTWVVLDSEMTTILGAASTPQEAMRRGASAQRQETFEPVVEDRPVMLQVPDPSTICFY